MSIQHHKRKLNQRLHDVLTKNTAVLSRVGFNTINMSDNRLSIPIGEYMIVFELLVRPFECCLRRFQHGTRLHRRYISSRAFERTRVLLYKQSDIETYRRPYEVSSLHLNGWEWEYDYILTCFLLGVQKHPNSSIFQSISIELPPAMIDRLLTCNIHFVKIESTHPGNAYRVVR